MERIAFLIPPDDRQLFCMLNPESVIVHRASGLTSRPTIGAASGLHEQSPVSLSYDGSQMTIIDMRLLFDVTLKGDVALSSEDVRDITGTLFGLTGPSEETAPELNVIRMIWGKNWSVPCVIVEISERLDYFNEHGEPRRSWLAMRVLVVDDDHEQVERIRPETAQALVAPETLSRVAEMKVQSDDETTIAFNDRLDTIAASAYGSPALWRVLAEYNKLDSIAPSGPTKFIKIPSMTALMGVKKND